MSTHVKANRWSHSRAGLVYGFPAQVLSFGAMWVEYAGLRCTALVDQCHWWYILLKHYKILWLCGNWVKSEKTHWLPRLNANIMYWLAKYPGGLHDCLVRNGHLYWRMTVTVLRWMVFLIAFDSVICALLGTLCRKTRMPFNRFITLLWRIRNGNVRLASYVRINCNVIEDLLLSSLTSPSDPTCIVLHGNCELNRRRQKKQYEETIEDEKT